MICTVVPCCWQRFTVWEFSFVSAAHNRHSLGQIWGNERPCTFTLEAFNCRYFLSCLNHFECRRFIPGDSLSGGWQMTYLSDT